MKKFSWFDRGCRAVLLGIATAMLTGLPVKAAEKIFVTYGPAKLSIKVASLEKFADTGEVDANLRFYFDLAGVTQEQKEQLRGLLRKRLDLNPVQVSRFFKTDIGEAFLTRVGRLATIPGGRNGKYAIRGALLSAALDTNGITAINFLQQLPTDLQLQGELLISRGKMVQNVVEATQEFVGIMATLSNAEAKTEPVVDFAQLTDPRQPGTFGVAPKQVWQLTDKSRDRSFYVNVFKPQRWQEGKTPVVVFSHGLASRPEDFDHLGEQLASYGFVVALPQHPGSDYQQAQNLLNGLTKQVLELDEFINRPKDVSFVIDELERRNASEFGGRLNLTEVGAAGHSFGGYTALALAGAEFDWEHLANECDPDIGIPNTSLLLQCLALKLPQQNYQFRDPRVTAIAVVNPVNNAVFGRSGLSKVTVPMVIAGGSYDPATPFVLEQTRSFPWIGSKERFFVLAEGQAHVDFSQLDAGATAMVKSFGDMTLPNPDLLRDYRNGLFTSFFQFYTADNKTYTPFITSASRYAQYLSQGQPFKIYTISEKSSQALKQELFNFAHARGISVPPQP